MLKVFLLHVVSLPRSNLRRDRGLRREDDRDARLALRYGKWVGGCRGASERRRSGMPGRLVGGWQRAGGGVAWATKGAKDKGLRLCEG